MTALIKRNYHNYNKIIYFYIDRGIRLLPQYIFYVLATTVFAYSTGYQHGYLKNLNVDTFIANMLIVPLDLYMFIDIGNAMIIPQAWSLGLEIMFYTVYPFIYIRKLQISAYISSLIVFIISCFGVIHTDIYGYRLLCGTLFIFIVGGLINDLVEKDKSTGRQRYNIIIVLLTYIMASICIICIYNGILLRRPFNLEVTLGIIAGMPIIYILANIPRAKFDDAIGNLSYGVFLNHFFIIFMLDYLNIPLTDTKIIILAIIISLIMSWVTYTYIEKPFIMIRHRLRDTWK